MSQNIPHIYYHAVTKQKIDSTHENPVRAGFIGSAHEHWHSSANPESTLKVIGKVSGTLTSVWIQAGRLNRRQIMRAALAGVNIS